MKTVIMGEFDLDAALNGSNVITAVGNKITTLSLYAKKQDDFCVKATDDRGITKFYNKLGKWKLNQETSFDLFMGDKPVTSPIYTKESAAIKSLEHLGYTYHGAEYWKPSCAKSTTKVIKPIFTQAMCNAGTLPSVGVECLVCITNGDTGVAGHIEYKNDTGILFKYKSNGLSDFYPYNEESSFKPIDPPIELIDGKAYQFEYMANSKTYNGIYQESDKRFVRAHAWVDVDKCTNIQLLEVKS